MWSVCGKAAWRSVGHLTTYGPIDSPTSAPLFRHRDPYDPLREKRERRTIEPKTPPVNQTISNLLKLYSSNISLLLNFNLLFSNYSSSLAASFSLPLRNLSIFFKLLSSPFSSNNYPYRLSSKH
jgi:hypothetical protein